MDMDSGCSIPSWDLKNLRSLCRSNTFMVFFSCQGICSCFITSTISTTYCPSRKTHDRKGPWAWLPSSSCRQMLCICGRTCLLWYFSSFSSQHLWEPGNFIIPHLADAEISAQNTNSYWIYPKLYIFCKLKACIWRLYWPIGIGPLGNHWESCGRLAAVLCVSLLFSGRLRTGFGSCGVSVPHGKMGIVVLAFASVMGVFNFIMLYLRFIFLFSGLLRW